MSKDIHAFRVWAIRSGQRTLELSVDQPNGRRLAIARVVSLQSDARADEIEMREHLVLSEDSAGPETRRRTLRWKRGPGHWYQLPDGNLRVHPSRNLPGRRST